MKTVLGIAGWSALALAIVTALLMVFVGNPFAQAPMTGLRPDDARLLALGEQVYRRQCAACHGAQLQGQPDWRQRDAQGLLPAPPHDASGHTWHHPDEVLIRITKYGVASGAGLASYRTAMPIYDGVLSDEEILAVLSWIKAQWPPHIRAKHDGMNQAAARQR
jgi:mono/diheme cytochrome c family protein